jgi:hypothetical protein
MRSRRLVRFRPSTAADGPSLQRAGELVDGLADAGVDLLESFRGALAEVPRRMGHTLAKLRGSSWGEPQREASADERACHQSDHEAVVSMSLCLCVHVELLSRPYVEGVSAAVHNGIDDRSGFRHAVCLRSQR